MATYYYDAQATGANDGSTKDDAFTTFAAAVAAANVDGDIIYHIAESQEQITTSTTYTFQASISIYCVDRATGLTITDPNDVGGYIGHPTSGQSVTLTGVAGKTVYLSHFRYYFTGAAGRILELAETTSGLNLVIDKLYAIFGTSGSSALVLGQANASAESALNIGHLYLSLGDVGQKIIVYGCKSVISGFTIDSARVTNPNALFVASKAGSYTTLNNCDFSGLSSGQVLVGDSLGTPGIFNFTNCKFPTSYVLLDAQTSGVPSSGECFAYNCQVATTDIPFEYANAFGNVKPDTGKYTNDNLSGDRSYLITTTAKVRTDTPFYGPWIEQYHDSTSSISPYFAIARDGSATAFDNDEVWAEFDAKVTASSAIKTRYSDMMALLGTPAAQTTDATTSWTGLGGTNWKGKVGEQALTPAEAGTLSGRIVVGLASASFNWDTRVRF